MTLQHSIEEFSENVRQDVLALAESEEQDVMLSRLVHPDDVRHAVRGGRIR